MCGRISCARFCHQIGPIDAIPDGAWRDAEFAVIEYILKSSFPRDSTPHSPVNTIGTDRTFLAACRVSTITRTIAMWMSRRSRSRDAGSRVYFNAPAKNGGHRGTDILESIRELDYYRKAVFVSDPGPTTDDVQAISHPSSGEVPAAPF
jgi:oligoribonuclease